MNRYKNQIVELNSAIVDNKRSELINAIWKNSKEEYEKPYEVLSIAKASKSQLKTMASEIIDYYLNS